MLQVFLYFHTLMKGCEKMDPYQYINEFSKFGGE